jgi:hypothetical protein
MNFTPKKENELTRRLLPDGVYNFEIMEGTDKISSEGNEMIELKIGIWDGDTIVSRVFDYLVEKVDYKLRHAADACGLITQYETGSLTGPMFEGKTGKVKLGTQKDKNGKYADKNVIKDYIKRESIPAPADTSGMMPSERAIQNDKNRSAEDDLPF